MPQLNLREKHFVNVFFFLRTKTLFTWQMALYTAIHRREIASHTSFLQQQTESVLKLSTCELYGVGAEIVLGKVVGDSCVKFISEIKGGNSKLNVNRKFHSSL